MLKINVNGKIQEIEKEISISELIKLNDVAQPGMVSVQLNGEFVYQQDYDVINVNAGDEVDFLYFMGGGSH